MAAKASSVVRLADSSTANLAQGPKSPCDEIGTALSEDLSAESNEERFSKASR
jgi:hypothetical protein